MDCFHPFISSLLRSSLSLSIPWLVLKRISSSRWYAKHHLLIRGKQVFKNQFFSFPWLKHFHDIESLTAAWQSECVVQWEMRPNRVLTLSRVWLKPFLILLVSLCQTCSLWKSWQVVYRCFLNICLENLNRRFLVICSLIFVNGHD